MVIISDRNLRCYYCHLWCLRKLRNIIKIKVSKDDCSISAIIKPNALYKQILSSAHKFSQGLSVNDYLVIVGGSNRWIDSEPFQASVYLVCKSLLKLAATTNIIVTSIAYRFNKCKYLNSHHDFRKKLTNEQSKYYMARYKLWT